VLGGSALPVIGAKSQGVGVSFKIPAAGFHESTFVTLLKLMSPGRVVIASTLTASPSGSRAFMFKVKSALGAQSILTGIKIRLPVDGNLKARRCRCAIKIRCREGQIYDRTPIRRGRNP